MQCDALLSSPLVHRPAHCEGIDADACPMGVPSYVPEGPPAAPRHFFVELQRLSEDELLSCHEGDFPGLRPPHVGPSTWSNAAVNGSSTGHASSYLEGLDMWSPR